MRTPWTTPEVVSVGRLPMHSVPHADRLPLDGTWRFQLLRVPDDAPGTRWREIEVPGLWTMADTWDHPHYTNVQMPFPGTPPTLPEVNPTGIYERTFRIPDAWEGKRVVLHVGAAESVLIVSIDGREIGLGKDSHLAQEFDVTDHVGDGTQTLRLTVIKWSDATYIEDQDQWWHGGISRSVYLYATDPVHLADVRIDAGLAEDDATGTLAVTAQVEFGPDGPQAGWTVEAHLAGIAPLTGAVAVPDTAAAPRFLSDLETRLVSGAASHGPMSADEREVKWPALHRLWDPEPTGRVRLAAPVPGVQPWFAEEPACYPLDVVLRDPAGAERERVRYQVGFRRVEVRGLDLLVNGRRVLLRGVNRHDADPVGGRVVPPATIREELVAMKRFGFNALRTAHYPNDPALLEIADELGLYVIAEADIESHAFWGTICNDPRYLPAWVDRVARMAIRDKNHCAVIAWSLGNESGYGTNHDAAAGWLRRYDPSRPLHYEGAIKFDWAGPQTVSDLTCPMYPTIASIVAHATNGTQRHPLVMCEYSHAMGNSNGTLAETWDAIESTPGLQGGFIWEWRDHALEQQLPGGRRRWAVGGDFGDHPNDGTFCADGLTWPDRRPKPALWEHRQLALPLRVTATPDELAAGRMTVRNIDAVRASDWLRATWELTVDGEPVEAGTLALPRIAPGGSATTELPAAAPVGLAPGAEAHLTIRFTTAADAAWAPAGTEMGYAQLLLGRGAPAAPVRAADGAVPLDADGRLALAVLAAGPRLALWRAPTDNDRIGGMAARWAGWGLDRLEHGPAAVTVDGPRTVVRRTVRTGAGHEIAHEQVLMRLADGAIRVEERATIPAALDDLPRVGTVLEVHPGPSVLTWLGRGPVETYPDRKRGAPVARWTSPVADELVSYVRPQECGGHAEVRRLELRDPRGAGLRIDLDVPSQVSALPIRPADLDRTRHEADLERCAETVIHLDAAHRGVGTASCGPDTLPEHLVRPGEHRWAWTIREG